KEKKGYLKFYMIDDAQNKYFYHVFIIAKRINVDSLLNGQELEFYPNKEYPFMIYSDRDCCLSFTLKRDNEDFTTNNYFVLLDRFYRNEKGLYSLKVNDKYLKLYI